MTKMQSKDSSGSPYAVISSPAPHLQNSLTTEKRAHSF